MVSLPARIILFQRIMSLKNIESCAKQPQIPEKQVITKIIQAFDFS